MLLGNTLGSPRHFVYGGVTLCARPFQALSTMTRLYHSPPERQLGPNGPTTPNAQRLPAITRARFSLIRFRSPLLTESRLLSLPAGTEMFHFPAFPPHALCVQAWVTGHVSRLGFPIRTSSNHSSVASSSRLIAGSYVLHRLLVPRHPPCALTNLTTDTKDARVHCAVLKQRAETTPHPAPTHHRPHHTHRRGRRPTVHRRGGPRETSPRPFPQDPTACQTTHHQHRRSTPHPRHPTRGTQDTEYSPPPAARSQLVDVPPTSNHPGTLIRGWPWTPPPTPPGAGRRQTLLRKEVIQPHLPVRLPCYDFVPIASPTFDDSLPPGVGPSASGVTDFRDVTGGVYKARERIHRSVADLRLLATPTSRGRVADPDPN